MTSEVTGGSTLKQTKIKLADSREICNGQQVSIIRFKPPSTDLESIQLAKYEAARFSTEHKIKTFEALGCEVKQELLDAFIAPVEFRELLLKLNQNSVGIIVQNPIPKTLQRFIADIPFEKDLDGLRENNPYFATSATSESIFRLVQPFTQEEDVVAIVGAKGFVGAGVVKLLKEAKIDTIELDAGDDLQRTRDANIVVSATGVPNLLDAKHITPEHRLVVDAGFVPEAGKPIRGDVNRAAYDIPQAITPVPGGVGPFQMATLLERLISRVSEKQIECWDFSKVVGKANQVTRVDPEIETNHDRLSGEQAKNWFKKFSEHKEIKLKEKLNLEKIIRLLDRELPLRLKNSLLYDDERKFPDSQEWSQTVLSNQKLALDDKTRQAFAEYLLDQVTATDDIVEVQNQDRGIERIAINVATNPNQASSKLINIQGLPEKSDQEGKNCNENIGKVRKELGITKHMVIVLNNARALLPTYDCLLSELTQFAQSNSKIGVKDLRNLSPELTIAGDYQQIAEPFQNRVSKQRLHAIANTSLERDDHLGYTVQLLLEDPSIKQIKSFEHAQDEAKTIAGRALSCTPQYQIASSIEALLKQHGKASKDGNTLELKQDNLLLMKKDKLFLIYDQLERGLIFKSNKFTGKVNQLTSKEKLRFLNHYNRQVLPSRNQKQNIRHKR